jgi:vitamin-K-epoxide reductase (warfarin-sensitive)
MNINLVVSLFRYGKGFGLIGPIFGEDSPLNIPNGFYGTLFYSTIVALSYSNNLVLAKLNKYLIVISNLLSIWLAFLLYFVLEDLCVVCVSTYVVNFANLIFSVKKCNLIIQEKQEKKVKKVK